MTALTGMALANAGVLRALHSGAHATPKALAEATGRDPKNMPRDLGRLEKNGLVVRAEGALPALTEMAEAALAELDRLGAAPAEFGLRHDQLLPDPDQPRKTFDPSELNGLSHSIDRHGLHTPLLVRPVDPATGCAVIIAGERRWRAIDDLIKWTEDGKVVGRGWTPDQPLPCRVVDVAERDRRLLAVMENIQRADVPNLELGQAFIALIDQDGMDLGDIAQELGKSKMFVADRVNVVRRATAETLAAFQRGEITWTALRDSVKAPTITPKMTLALVELADAIERFPDATWTGYTKIRIDVGTDSLPDLEHLGFAERLPSSRNGIAFERITGKGGEWVDTFAAGRERAEVLHAARVAVIGEGAAADLRRLDTYASRFLAFPKSLPSDDSDDDDADQDAPPSPFPLEGGKAGIGGEPAERAGSERVAPPAPSTSPSPGHTPNLDHSPSESPAVGSRRGSTPFEGEGSPIAALTPRERLALLELAHKIQHSPAAIRPLGKGAATIGKYWTAGSFAQLAQVHRLIIPHHGPDHPPVALLTDKGLEWLTDEGLIGDDGLIAIDAEMLERARAAVSDALGPEPYSTAWLIEQPVVEQPVVDAAAEPAPEQPETDPAEIAAAEALGDIAEALDHLCRSYDLLCSGTIDHEVFRTLAATAERDGPFRVGADIDEAGIVWARNGEAMCVCDSNGELPTDLARAQALLVCAALNLACGFRPLSALEADPEPSSDEEA